jgi:hypothetical protein
MASHNHDDDDKRAKARAQAQAAQGEVHAADTKALDKAHHDEPQAAPAKPVGETPEQKAARANDSIGAQVVLDPASDAALAARGGATGSIEDNTAVLAAATPRIIGLSHDAVGGTVKGPREKPELHRPVPWVEPPATRQMQEEVRAEAIAQIVSP